MTEEEFTKLAKKAVWAHVRLMGGRYNSTELKRCNENDIIVKWLFKLPENIWMILAQFRLDGDKRIYFVTENPKVDRVTINDFIHTHTLIYDTEILDDLAV